MKNEKRALEGPVGTVSLEQSKELENVPILGYSYFNGILNGTTFGKSFWKSFSLNPDNNINKPVYGMKGREVLTGKQIDPAVVLTGISAYRDALIKHYRRFPSLPPNISNSGSASPRPFITCNHGS